MSAVLTAEHSHAAPALEQNLQRALALCQELEAAVDWPRSWLA